MPAKAEPLKIGAFKKYLFCKVAKLSVWSEILEKYL